MFSANNTNNTTGIFGNSNTNNNLFGSSTTNNTNSSSLFGSTTNNGSSNTPLFGSNTNNGSSKTSLFGSNNTTLNTTSNGSLLGGANMNSTNTNPAPLFGSNTSSSVNTTGSLFNSSNSGNNTNGSALFPSTSTNTGTGLFGGQQKSGLFSSSTSATGSQNNPLFGQSTSNTGGTGLFGQNQPNTLFGQGSQVNMNQSNANQSLFNMQSPFSYSSDTNVIYRMAQDQIKQDAVIISQTPSSLPLSQLAPNSASTFSQPYNQFQPPIPNNGNNNMSLNLGSTLSSGYRRPAISPSWAQERKLKSFQLTSQKHKIIFITISVAYGIWHFFFRGSKTFPHKKKTFIQEDPPPTKNIYDNDPRNSVGSFVNDKTGKGPTDGHLSSGFGNSSSTSLSSSSSSKPVKSVSSSQISSLSNTSVSTDVVSVIIFGFPASLTQSVVSYFARFGNILENVDSTRRFHQATKEKKSYPTEIHTGKNWLKITYESPVSAARAIQENGVVFAGQYIIGCVPATSQKLKEFEKAGAIAIDGDIAQENYFNTSSLTGTIDDEENITNDQLKTPQKNNSNGHSLSKSPFGNQKNTKGDTIPIINGSKHKAIKDGKNIFNPPAKQLHTLLIFKYAQENDKGSNTNISSSKRLQAGKTGWLSWTGKKAQELVFGWDDL